MKKILEKIGKDELLEYSRLGDRFSVGNYIGNSSKFHIFTSINPYGKYEGYKFLKNEELKKLGRKKWYLELMKGNIKERLSNEGKMVILRKDSFFKHLFEYFVKNKIRLQISYDRDWNNNGYLIKNSDEFFWFHFCDEEDKNEEEIIRKYGVKIIRAGKNVIKDIIVEDSEIKKNKLIKVYDLDDVLGDIIFQDNNYILIYEKDLFFGDYKFTILKMSDIEEINDRINLIKTKDINLEKIFPNIVKMKIQEVLKKCFENKILVHFEYEKSYSEKFGIIEKFDNEKITLKEIDKMMGIFVSKSEILVEDVSFLFVRNCKVLGIGNLKKGFVLYWMESFFIFIVFYTIVKLL